MRALIVDDERHVREAIQLLVDWHAHGIEEVLEAQDVPSAIKQIERAQPQIVFTDMLMPGRLGTDLLAWIREHAPATKVVVISGHDDFDLVRKTVLFGGMDYILKPIDPEQLNQAVAKAVKSRKQEDEGTKQEQRKAIEINQLRPVYWDKMLTNLVEDPAYFASIGESLRTEFGLSDNDRFCRVAMLATDTIPPAVRRKFAGSEDLLLFSLLNICNEIVRKQHCGVAFRHERGTIVVLLWRMTESAVALLETVNAGIRQAFGSLLEFGLGGQKPMPKGIKLSYHDAHLALRQRNMRVMRPPVCDYRPDDAPRLTAVHLTEFEERVRFAIKSGQEQPVKDIVNSWMSQVASMSYINTEQFELWDHEYNVIRARLLKELFGDSPSGSSPLQNASERESIFAHVPVDQEGRLALERVHEALERDLLHLSSQWVAHGRQEEHAIFDIVKYIDSHYATDITLQDLADRFYLSREYISRKFKQQFQENLSDYIERVRMEKAKLLLMNPQYRIAQIAESVGYKDEKYFSKVFKKLEGLSPNEFRKREN